MEKKMWDWLYEKTNEIVNELPHFGKHTFVTRSDIASQVMLNLWEHKEYAEQIYKNQNLGLLCLRAKEAYFEYTAKHFLCSSADYSRFRQILEVCERYSIPVKVENAYKIAELMGEQYTIGRVIGTLTATQPIYSSLYMGNDIKCGTAACMDAIMPKGELNYD